MNKVLPVLALLLPSLSLAGVGQETWAWNPVTTDVNGNPLTGITYNVYVGPAGAETLNSNITATSFTYLLPGGKTICAQFTAVANGVESARTPEVCGTSSFPTPMSPTGLTVK